MKVVEGLGPIINSTNRHQQPQGMKDQFVNERRIGGPLTALDVRMFIGAETLDLLLKVASSSSVNQVQLNRVGIIAQTWRESNGHEYEVWKFVSDAPTPAKNGLMDQYAAAKDLGFAR